MDAGPYAVLSQGFDDGASVASQALELQPYHEEMPRMCPVVDPGWKLDDICDRRSAEVLGV